MLENEFTRRIIGAAIEVHKILGPGLLESSYIVCAGFVFPTSTAPACHIQRSEAQLLTYLRLAGLSVGLLVNFNVPVLKKTG